MDGDMDPMRLVLREEAVEKAERAEKAGFKPTRRQLFRNAAIAGGPVLGQHAAEPAAPHRRTRAYMARKIRWRVREARYPIVSLVKEGPVVGCIVTPGSLNIRHRLDGTNQAIQASAAETPLT